MGGTLTPFVIGNWKLNPGPDQALDLALACATIAESAGAKVDVGIAVPFPYLPGIAGVIPGSRLQLGAQDVSAHESGAYTGEVAACMVAAWTDFTLIGHSERRLYQGERDETVAAKTKLAIAAGLTAIVCVGESLAQREAGDAETIVRHQLATAIEGLDGLVASSLVIAYEPVWAIGTGVSAQPSDAGSMGRVIRNTLAGLGPEARSIRILYGGSVTPGNAASYLAQPEVDGALVGGASLQPESFANIVEAAAVRPR